MAWLDPAFLQTDVSPKADNGSPSDTKSGRSSVRLRIAGGADEDRRGARASCDRVDEMAQIRWVNCALNTRGKLIERIVNQRSREPLRRTRVKIPSQQRCTTSNLHGPLCKSASSRLHFSDTFRVSCLDHRTTIYQTTRTRALLFRHSIWMM